MNTCSFAFTEQTSSQGYSREADFVVAESNRISADLERSHYLFGLTSAVLDELARVSGEASEPGWDGYDAKATTGEAYWAARRFLLALQFGPPMPTVGAEPDGDITLEWYDSPRRVLSVSVSPDGNLHYAALIGASSHCGTERFYGTVPEVILALIRRVCPG